MTKHYKLKAEPNAPKRLETIQRSFHMESSDTLSDLLSQIGDTDPSLVSFDVYNTMYDSAIVSMFFWDQVDTEEMFAERVKLYEKKLAAYNHWYSENKDDIRKEVARRKERERLSEIESNISRKKDLEDRLAMLEIEKVKLEKRKKALD